MGDTAPMTTYIPKGMDTMPNYLPKGMTKKSMIEMMKQKAKKQGPNKSKIKTLLDMSPAPMGGDQKFKLDLM